MPTITYLDVEASQNTYSSKRNEGWKIVEIGAIENGKTFRGKELDDLKTFIQGSEYLCGHNLVDHDLEMLRQAGLSSEVSNTIAIDTLYISPLLFPDKEAYKLDKDYTDYEDGPNDPVADAQLCMDLLSDLRLRWDRLESWQQWIYASLLVDDLHFSGFLQWVGFNKAERLDQVAHQIRQRLSGRICKTQDLDELESEQPVELAYALAQLLQTYPKNVTPAWALNNFPKLSSTLYRLRRARCENPECTYCQKQLDPVAVLKRHFGFESFRPFEGDTSKPLQQQAVEAALNQQSFIAIFPTGGGKSLTYQLPTLMANESQRALTVVISPLQSLMKDQVDVLQNRHDIVNAVTINGLLSPLERRSAIERVASGEVA